jgi:hypothetical protein
MQRLGSAAVLGIRSVALALSLVALAATPTLAGAHRAGADGSTAHEASLAAVPKFIFHAGLAFGAFHHFIFAPFKDGKFMRGSLFSKIKTYAGATLAGAFTYHETKLALEDAKQNKALSVLVAPLTALVPLFDSIVAKIKGRNLDTSSIDSVESAITSIEERAKSAGSTVAETIPSTKQLAAGSA